MKKLMTMIGAVGLAFAASAAFDDALLAFSTVGPDKYSDDTPVLDGECYALVWTPEGSTFGGIAADGKPIGADEIILVAPLAKDHHCPKVLFQIDSAQVSRGGTYGVYLLDTRVTADGTTSPAGLKGDGTLKLVNGYGLATEAVQVAKVSDGGVTTSSEKDTEGGQVASTGAAVPPSSVGKQPKITSIKIEGANVILTVQNLPGFMRLNSGADVSASDVQGAAKVTDGSDEEVVFIAPKSESGTGFFKVIHNN